jgi:formylglycine-generating enzyme required for sulfatase activity
MRGLIYNKKTTVAARTLFGIFASAFLCALVFAGCGEDSNPPEPAAYPLTVGVKGSGSGSVTKTVSGVLTTAASFDSGTVVTLTARADSGSVFAGWASGSGCRGIDSCKVTVTRELSVSAIIQANIDSEIIEMVLVGGGTFTMGCTDEQGGDCEDDESPPYQATLTNDYYLGKYEVTQALWSAVMGVNPSDNFSGGDSLPVESVTWTNVQTFLIVLNSMTGKKYRLPTEAEWEYAARGGAKSKGYKYSGSGNLDEVAWTQDNCGGSTKPVGKKKPNELGIHDMSGNVFEWVNDWYGDYTPEAKTNPAGYNYTGPLSASFRLCRGGSYNYPLENCRISFRRHDRPDNWGQCIGLRLAHSSEGAL